MEDEVAALVLDNGCVYNHITVPHSRTQFLLMFKYDVHIISVYIV